MYSLNKIKKVYKSLALFAGTLAFVSGLIFLLNWHFGLFAHFDVSPHTFIMPYYSGLCFFCIGLAFFTLFYIPSIPIANFLGFIVAVISFSRWFELTLNLDLGLSTLVPHRDLPNDVEKVMSGAGSVGYFLIGITFLGWVRDRTAAWQSAVTLLGAYAIISLAVVGVLTYFLPVPIVFQHYVSSSLVNLFSSSLGIVIGIGILAASNYFDLCSNIRIMKLQPILTTVFLSVISLVFSLGMESQQTAKFHQYLNSEATRAKNLLEADFDQNADVLKAIVNIIDPSKAYPLKDAEASLAEILQMNIGIQAVQLFDANLVPKEIYPIGQNILTPVIQKEIENKRDQHHLPFSRIGQINDKLMLYLFFPVVKDQTFQGMLLFVLDLVKYFEKEGDYFPHLSLVILSGTNEIVSLHEREEVRSSKWRKQTSFTLMDNQFALNLYPTSALLNSHINENLLYYTLCGGLLAAIFLGLLINSRLVANEHIRSIEQYQLQLLEAQKQEKTNLNAARIGTWSWDIKRDHIIADEFALSLFGIRPQEFNGTFQDFVNRVLPEDQEYVTNTILRCLETGEKLDYMYRVPLPNGKLQWVNAKGKLFTDEKTQARKMAGIIWEITAVKQAQLQLESSEAIAKVLSENKPIDESLNKILPIFYKYFGWEVMVLWLLDEKSNLLNCSKVIKIPSMQISEFERATLSLSGASDVGIASRVMAHYRPFWMKDFTQDPTIVRSKEGAKDGIRGALAFPMFYGQRFTGALELYKRAPFSEDVDEGLLNVMNSFGLEFGQFLQRKIIEDYNAELVSAVKFSHDGIYTLNKERKITSWNLAAENIFGMKAKDVLGNNIETILPPSQFVEFHSLLNQCYQGVDIDLCEMQIENKMGQKVWLDNTMSPIKDAEDQVTGATIIVMDISTRMAIVERLSKSEEKYRSLVETTDEWVWELDDNNIFVYSNPSVNKILGYEIDEIIGKDVLTLLQDNEREKYAKNIQDCKEKRRGWNRRIAAWKHRDGSIKWIECYAQPILSKSRQVTGFRAISRDITERKNIERTKNEFISMVSHELRTPLTSIRGSLGILIADPLLSEKNKNLTDIAIRNTDRLTAIINDVIDIEKIELGQIQYSFNHVSLKEFLDTVIQSAMATAEQSGIKLVKEEEFDRSLVVNVDQKRLFQAVMNLVSNAIKFTRPESSVFISLKKIDEHARIFIRDQGYGIPEEYRSKLFQKFSQGEASDARTSQGAGLGLYISKNIIERMGGRIHYTTKLNEGTTFYIDLPLT